MLHLVFQWDASSISIWNYRKKVHTIQELTLLLFPLETLENEPTHSLEHVLFPVKLNLTLESGRRAAIHTLGFAHVWIFFNSSSATSQLVLYCVYKGLLL